MAALEIFRALDTQWREGFNGRIGLDYTAAQTVCAALNVKFDRDLLDRLMVLENEILAICREQRARNNAH